MKKIIFIIISFFAVVNIYSQTGIRTKTPSSSAILELSSTTNKGVLIPRVELVATNNKHPLSGTLTNGTLVFNTVKNGTGKTAVIPSIYVWIDGNWVFPSNVDKEPNYVAKFTNLSTNTTNFNPASTNITIEIPIFNSQVINDDTAVFERINSTSIRIKKDGLYLLSTNLALKEVPSINESRLSDYIYFKIDNQLASSKVITLVPQYDPSSINIDGRFAFGLNAYSNIKAGQILTLVSERYKNGVNYNGTLNFDNTSLSSVSIIKLN